MQFYRQATGQDFQKAEMSFEERIPLPVRIAYDQGGRKQAVKRWREHTGIGAHDALKQLDEYDAFRRAFTDFLADKPVYTDY